MEDIIIFHNSLYATWEDEPMYVKDENGDIAKWDFFGGDEAGLTGGKDPKNRKPYPWNNINEEVFLIYKSLGNLRSSEEVFKKGDFKIIDISQDILVYERKYKDKK